MQSLTPTHSSLQSQNRRKQGPRMEHGLMTALGTAPPLLVACVEHDSAVLPSLRLVSTECSRLGLLGLTVFSLKLEGGLEDTDVARASLLRGASLQTLSIHLCLTGVQGRVTVNAEQVDRMLSTAIHSTSQHTALTIGDTDARQNLQSCPRRDVQDTQHMFKTRTIQ